MPLPGDKVWYWPTELDGECELFNNQPLCAWVVYDHGHGKLTLRILTAGDTLPVRKNVSHVSQKLDYLDYWIEYEKTTR